MPELTDQELVNRANAGDAQAFEQLYTRHRGWVVALAQRFTGNNDDALDVLQDTFTYLFKKFPGFQLTTNLRGFLFPVVRNTSISVLRQRRKVIDLDETREDKAGRLAWHSPETAGDLDRIVALLPEAQRQVVLLRFGGQMRLEEIADALVLPLGTVKSRLHNALKSLRSHLASEAAGV